MKNSVKFFLGGIAAATLIFAAFAFTTKQAQNKEYLVVRVVEDAVNNYFVVQVCDKNGKVEYTEEETAKAKKGIYYDETALHTQKLAAVINKYAGQGYELTESTFTPFTMSGGFSGKAIYTTLIFEK